MKRREFLGVLGSAALMPVVVRAQQRERVRRIGVLMPLAVNDPQGQARTAAFLLGLQQSGWSDGSNLQIDYRWAAGDHNRVRKYAAELVALAPAL